MYKTAKNALWNHTGRLSISSRLLIGEPLAYKDYPRRLNSSSPMSQQSTPEIGATSQASFQVDPPDLANSIAKEPQDVYPAVFATSRLVALMEIACARILVPHLDSTQLSVGVRIDANHTAATGVGGKVTARATYKGREGKLFVFDVVAEDSHGEVGKAMHTRAIIDRARLESSAEKRAKPRGNL